MRRTSALLLILCTSAAALLPVACGDDGGERSDGDRRQSGDRPTTTQERSTSTSTGTWDTTETTRPTTTLATTTTVPGPTRSVTELTPFASPTGNIGCYIDPETVRCDIAERAWSPPPTPADCDLEYGHGFWLDADGTADFVCAGDTAMGDHPVLAYGESIQAGDLRCTSRQSGMTCVSLSSGHGFTLSRNSYELF